jgi:hypothetical protein
MSSVNRWRVSPTRASVMIGTMIGVFDRVGRQAAAQPSARVVVSRRTMRIPRFRLTPTYHLTAIATLAALTVGAPVAALQAQTPRTPVHAIRIVGTPTLHVDTANASHGYKSAWVLFRTSPHLHEPRQVVVRVHGMSGRSFGNAGARNCVRSTIIRAANVLRPGAKYRVQFHVRAGAHGKTTRIALTRTLVARGASRLPRCSSG